MPEDKGKEILRQMREDSGSKRYIDQEREQLRKDADRVIHSGTLDEFREILRRAGVDPESARGKLLIDRLITLGASGRSPR
jgi:hypothetical protein